MPAGLFASLAGAACEPMRKVCPVRRPRSILPGDSAPEGYLRGRMPLPAVCTNARPVPAASIAPLCRHPPYKGPRHCIWPSASRPSSLPLIPYPLTAVWLPCAFPLAWPCPVAVHPPIRFLLSGPPGGGASLPALQRQKIVRSTSIFPAIPAPLCKEK